MVGRCRMNNQITEYIKQSYDYNDIILTDDLIKRFPDVPNGTIRQTVKRLSDKNAIVRAAQGVYFRPNPDRLLKKPVISVSDIINRKYIYENDKIIGYSSGLNFANKLGVTTQTASVETIKSNAVSNKKRTIRISNNKIQLIAPRVKVNKSNYMLLQVLDLLNDFEQYSAVPLSGAEENVKRYLKRLDLSAIEIEKAVSKYPLSAQVKFYKLGVFHEITQRERAFQ